MSFTQDQGNEQTTDQLTFKVGEREFNAESATNKIQSADEHIRTIEQENAAFKAELAEAKAKLEQSTKLDDALEKLKANQQFSQESQSTPETTGVSEEQIGAIATKQMEEYLAQQRLVQAQADAETLATKTYQETGEALQRLYGDKVDEAVADKAKELGINAQELYGMAKNPVTAKMLLESMKIPQKASQATPSGSINTSGSYHQAPEKFMDYSLGEKKTSSDIVEALKRADATY